MKLHFRQRFFSWFDSYDIYYEDGSAAYTVKGQLSWGHLLNIYDARGECVGTVKEKVFTWLPKFELYYRGNYIGKIQRELTLIKPKYDIDFNGWHVEGSWTEWDYQIYAANGAQIATISKELLHMTDNYTIDVTNPNDALSALMLVLAIDAEKCSRD